MVCPDQPWLDGCNIGGGVIRQFVAMPLGEGYGLGADTARGEGGLDIIAFEPLPGHFPDAAPPPAGPMKLSRIVVDQPMEMRPRALSPAYRAIRDKHVPRYFAEFEYRFNRRYDLAAMMPRLGYVAVRTPPMPYRLLKLAENHA